MYAFLRGKLIQTNPNSAILEVQGVGYHLYMTSTHLAKLPHPGSEIMVHTSLVIRELSHALYGFLERNEKELFEVLIGLSGLGPKLALAIIGHLSLSELQSAVRQGQIFILSKVPGIGKKKAEKLIIELKDKLPAHFPRDESTSDKEKGSFLASSHSNDAILALINLGYTQTKAQQAIEKVLREDESQLDLASLITLSLKKV